MRGLWLVSYVALWILFLAVALVLVSILRNQGVLYTSIKAATPRLEAAPSALKPGQTLPLVTWQTLAGESRTLAELRGVKLAIALVSPSCKPCIEYLLKLGVRQASPDPLDPGLKRTVIVSLGDLPGTARLLEQAQLPSTVPVFVDVQREVAERWGISTTPTTVIVDEELRVVRQVFGRRVDHAPHGLEPNGNVAVVAPR